MGKHARPERAREHLRAEADAEERLIFLQRLGGPIDLAADEAIFVIGAHRPAEKDGGGVVAHGLRQRVAKARAAHVQPVAQPLQRVAHPSGRGMFLMQDNQYRL